ncbi:MAG: transglycosylase SLT domain-containing protein [Gammaproteobacteria bacterium]
MTWMSCLFAVFLLVFVVPAALAADITTERAEFKLAWAAAQKGDLATLTPFLDELADYPLYPYLRYAYLDSTLAQQPAGAVESFLKEQAQLPVADALRQAWLLELAKQEKWNDFLTYYQNDSAPALRCAAVSAHLVGDDTQDRDAWIVAAQHLWLVPRTQPDTCDPAFRYLKAHRRIANDMVVQRMQGALQARHYTLAQQLLPQLDAVDRPWARIWLEMAADPAQMLDSMQVPDEPKYQTLLINGVQLVARTDPARARHLWTVLSRRYHFGQDDTQDMAVRLALESAWDHLPDAAALLVQVKRSDDPRVTEWRIRTALRNGKWETVLKILPALGPETAKPEWRYWQARALAATSQTKKADAIYQSLADGMDYYGFLAADQLNLSYAITQEPSKPAPDVITQLGERPGFVRARELFYADLYTYANAEWLAASTPLSKPARCQTALMAQEWGWYGRAIQTLVNTGCWGDLTISYPLAFEATLVPRVKALDLNLPWLYGLIRAESVFRPDAVSAAGAVGLMQLMPGTGRRVAANLGLVLDDDDALLDPANNLTLGSAYLSDMLKRFDGSEPLATAAYNAGPKRVNSWLPQSGSIPADVWVDTIPFWETRSYVRRVLSSTVIFDWRLHGTTERLSTRLGTIPADVALTVNDNH